MMKTTTLTISAIAALALLGGCAEHELGETTDVGTAQQDLGSRFWDHCKVTENILNSSSMSLFGFNRPAPTSAPATRGPFRSLELR